MLGAIFLRKKSVIFVPIFTFSLPFLLSNDTFKSLVVSFSRPNNWFPRTFAFAKYKQSTWKKHLFIHSSTLFPIVLSFHIWITFFDYSITKKTLSFFAYSAILPHTISIFALSHYSPNIFVRLNAMPIRMSLSMKSHNLRHTTITVEHS